jgi:hypothetical protein
MPSSEQAQSSVKENTQQKLSKPAVQDFQDIAAQPLDESLLIQRAMQQPRTLAPRDALRLQGMLNNRAMTEILTGGGPGLSRMAQAQTLPAQTLTANAILAHTLPASEAQANGGEPDQQIPDTAPIVTSVEVTSVIRGGSNTPETHEGGSTPSPDAIVAEQAVAPVSVPAVGSGGGNNCTPGIITLNWNVVEAGENWRANVTSMTLPGQINITAWPSNPSAMTVPNTPNPVEGGNINKTNGSPNQWQDVINDMSDYDNSSGGGAGPNWHSTGASSAHEWAHWIEDYLHDALPAGNWAGANADIDAMTVAKSAQADAAAARTALQPRVAARFQAFWHAVVTRWNTLIKGTDKPGAGGRGYAAGKAVLNGLIDSVRSFAASKGWQPKTGGALRGAAVGAGIGGLVAGPLGAAIGAGVGGLVGSRAK